jgi:thymidylate synthase
MANTFEEQYIQLINNVLDNGTVQYNERTGKNCHFYHGEMMKFDLSGGNFPLLTTKKMDIVPMVGELLGFIRGVDNAKDFRDLKCNFWNANANESVDWVNNPNRLGEDDLGRIYGVQARDWKKYEDDVNGHTHHAGSVDQLSVVVDKLSRGVDDRRLIVTHWNPGEVDKMALPPCHMFYQFGIRKGYLDLVMYQRSCDVPLGVPMNIASYSLLLLLITRIAGLKPGVFTHFLWNVHIYEDQLDAAKEQIIRTPFDPPQMWINRNIKSLDDLETWVTPKDFKIENYEHHGKITYPFSA